MPGVRVYLPTHWPDGTIPPRGRAASSSELDQHCNSREIVVPMNERNTCVARTNGFDAPPSRSYPPSWIGDRDAFVVQHIREPGIVGYLERAFEQDLVAAYRAAEEVLTATDPDRFPDTGHSPAPLHRADVDHRRPAEPAHRRIRAQGAGHRDPLRTERGQERPGEAGILDPGPSQREAEDADHSEHPHGHARPSPFEAGRRDGFERG